MGIYRIRNKSLTLIELIITIGIATILAGVVVFMLRASFEAYSFGQKQVLLEKVLDECLEEITSGGFKSYGIKDVLEILEISPHSITFVPLWVDDSHDALLLKPNEPIILNRPVKPSTFLPLAEVSPRTKIESWKTVPITFIPGSHKDPTRPDDVVFLNAPLDLESKIRFVFQPEAKYFSDCAMTIAWRGDKIIRIYKGKSENISPNIRGVKLTDFRLQYFDNTNIPLQLKPDLIHSITAIKLILEASLEEGTRDKSPLKKQGFAFVNIRNTRAFGRGLIVQEGMRIRIPDSKNIRVFSLSNVSGIKKGGIIELEARPKKGAIWRVRISLGLEDDKPILKRYSVEYPPGRIVYSETINLTYDLPFNFLTLGGNGRYDYDFDKDTDNVVNLEDEVELVVTKMDAAGAALFIRP